MRMPINVNNQNRMIDVSRWFWYDRRRIKRTNRYKQFRSAALIDMKKTRENMTTNIYFCSARQPAHSWEDDSIEDRWRKKASRTVKMFCVFFRVFLLPVFIAVLTDEVWIRLRKLPIPFIKRYSWWTVAWAGMRQEGNNQTMFQKRWATRIFTKKAESRFAWYSEGIWKRSMNTS